MRVLAIDPGPEKSAFVVWDHDKRFVVSHAIEDNHTMLNDTWLVATERTVKCPLVVEMVASYGMAVGAEVFDTCVWIGRYVERFNATNVHVLRAELMFRRTVKLHLCGAANAKDANIRQALIDRFGPGKDKAIGTKKQPGPLYGIKADEWQALALAVTWADKQKEAP